jgi:hypothetical protein
MKTRKAEKHTCSKNDTWPEHLARLKAEAAQPTPAAHTPTPWKTVIGVGAADVSDKKNTAIARCMSFNGLSQKQAEVNAAFIVRAVNSHEALLAYAKRRHLCGLGKGCEECEMIAQAEEK